MIICSVGNANSSGEGMDNEGLFGAARRTLPRQMGNKINANLKKKKKQHRNQVCRNFNLILFIYFGFLNLFFGFPLCT